MEDSVFVDLPEIKSWNISAHQVIKYWMFPDFISKSRVDLIF